MTIFLISDTHLNHKNIIKYCNRPFTSVEEMNDVIVKNWNSVVKEDDTVHFLGDLCFPRGYKTAEWWLSQLNGKINATIKGNHDKKGIDSYFLEYKGYTFKLVHFPQNRGDWDGVLLHGHIHNNNVKEYPFINYENKTVNVSVEMIDYTPISIEDLISKNLIS